MEKSQVNEKYVLTLVENSDATLSVRRMDIPSSEVPIAELEAMVLLKEILIHRSPIYRRFLHDYVVWYCKDTKLYQIIDRNI